MDSIEKTNNIFKILGIIFILLAMTIFANAETYQFDCDGEFNCSIKSYCQDVPGAVPGLLVHYGGAFSYDLGDQPIDYTFTSTTPGVNICSINAKTTAMYDQGQGNEVTAIYVNGNHLATTADNYCNADTGGGCTFCGIDSQNLGQFTVTLEETNTLTVIGEDSHALIAVTLDCVPQYDPCYYN